MKSESKKRPPKKEQLYTVHALSALLGTDRNTINRHIAASKIKPAKIVKGRKVYRREPIENSIGIRAGGSYADLRAEQIRQQTRESRERADILAMKKARDRGETILMSELQTVLTETLLPVRQRIVSLPAECCTRVNPTDPVFAREQLQRWVDEALPQIREKLPQPKAAKEKGEE